jgi:Tfp pilus assembly protein PilF
VSNPPGALKHKSERHEGALSPTMGGRRMYWVGAALIAIVVTGIGAYVGHSRDALSPKPMQVIAAARAAAPSQKPTAIEPAAALELATHRATSGTARPALRAPASLLSMPLAAASVERPALLQPVPAAERARIAPEVSTAYDALRRGDFAAARRSYSRAHASDPENVDAALGLATVEAYGGQREAAAALYGRVLALDPRNVTALAGLAALAEVSRDTTFEPQLLRVIAQQPSAAPLHFALGNLYASQSQWAQAQAAYFEAHRLEPGNADVMHNLAVSLDRLGQPRIAEAFYRRALDAAGSGPTQFDTAAAARRLAEFEPAR